MCVCNVWLLSVFFNKLLNIFLLLLQFAFDHAYKNQLDVTCQCDFLAKFYKENQKNYRGLKVTLDLGRDE